MRANYFEGTLQLRDPTNKLLDYVKSRIKAEDIVIAKQVIHKNGRDLFLSSNKFMVRLGKDLKRKFVGQLTITRKLFSKSKLTSKEIYRVTVLFKQFQIHKGSKVTYRGEQFEVISIANALRVRSLETGKKRSLKFQDLK